MFKGHKKFAGLYIHIPFCQKKCLYCDFYSITDLAESSSFLAALEREMELAAHPELEFDTLYIGGGTPSVLEAHAIEHIIASSRRHFDIRAGAEITIEVNPGTVTFEDLQSYRRFGVNRINIGIQSFQNENLEFLGRIHSSEQAFSSIDWARQAGFENIGLDLIYGLPAQDETRWLNDLDQAVRIHPQHLSCYLLTCEPGTPLDNEVTAGRMKLPPDDHLGKLFQTTSDYLTHHGYLHYEVSNFARKADGGGSPWESRHNRKYWSLATYIGLGPSSHSYLEPERYWNHRSIKKYLQDIRKGKLPLADRETLTREQMIIEAIYLGLRTVQGIHINEFKRRFGIDFFKAFDRTVADFEKDGLIKIAKGHCRVTRKGLVLLDGITAEFTSQEFP